MLKSDSLDFLLTNCSLDLLNDFYCFLIVFDRLFDGLLLEYADIDRFLVDTFFGGFEGLVFLDC